MYSTPLTETDHSKQENLKGKKKKRNNFITNDTKESCNHIILTVECIFFHI